MLLQAISDETIKHTESRLTGRFSHGDIGGGGVMPKGSSGNMQTVRIMAHGRREVEVQGYIINVEGHDFMIHRTAYGSGWNLSDYASGLGVSNRVGESRAYYERYLAENATTLADIARKAHSVEAVERRPRIINR